MSIEIKKENDPELGDGFQIIRLGYWADETKDAKWAEKVKQEYPTEDWEREFELKPVGLQDVRPVFADYHKVRHEDENLSWRPSIERIIYRGWDFGKVHPACEFMQVIGLERNFIYEVAPDNILEDQFVQLVLSHSSTNFRGATFVDWVDISGRNVDRWGNSSMKTLKSYGIHPRGKDQEIEPGIHEMCKGLVQSISGQNRPCLMVNPTKCPKLAGAMRGGYKRNKKGEIIKDGIHDHYVDAARYAYTGVATDSAKSWDKVRQQMRSQYGKFPTSGKSVRR